MKKLTKTERLRRARQVRRVLSFYVDFHSPALQKEYPDWETLAFRFLIEARAELEALINLHLQDREDFSDAG